MAEIWIEEAEDLTPAGTAGTMTRNHGGVKVTWHVTVSPSGGSMFAAMHGVLTRNRSEPHVLYDPLTDRLGQYFPLNRSARALGNDGTRPTNRDGTINIQIEVVAQPDGFTRYWKPGPNYRALMRAIRSWGIPDVWPAGPLAPSGRADQQVSRSWSHYVKSGHFGHCNVPGNDHWDPGPIDQRAIFTGATGTSAPATLPPLDEQEWTPTGDWSTRDIQELVGVTVDGQYGPATEAAVRDLQKSLNLTPDGLWGKTTEGAVMTILDSMQADLKRVLTTQNAHTSALADLERWTRMGVNASRYDAPNKVLAGVASVLADTQGVDVDKLAAAIAEQIRDDVAKAGSGATAEQIADVLAKRLAG